MKYNYYPGCTLKTKAQHLERYALAAAEVLGVELIEQQDWQCCGAVYPMANDELATRLSSVRALAAAKDNGGELVTLCSACHHVIKRVNADMRLNKDINTRINNYLALEEKYNGETKVLHYLEVLRDVLGFEQLAQKVTQPLSGKKVAAYYGCMLLRPAAVMDFDDPENPTIMEDFIKALGATPVIYPYRNECCGGYKTMGEPQLAGEMVDNIMHSAKAHGAEMILSACPLCTYNLEQNCSAPNKIPVYYFTELLAQSLGVKE